MAIKSPVTVYVIHHPACKEAEYLCRRLYEWFRLGHLSGHSTGAGLPVYFRRQLPDRDQVSEDGFFPSIEFDGAELNVVIALVDYHMVFNSDWREAIVTLSELVASGSPKAGRTLLLPAAMHDSFYRIGPLYENFNPVRLLGMERCQMEDALRRAVTEAAARKLREWDNPHPPPLEVFLSHAKQDGIPITERIRDGVRNFGQLVAWYDANDLPYGADWKSPMVRAAQQDTAAMVATMTDAYPTRPWCRMEATLARTPSLIKGSRVWKVQPVVAVDHPGDHWVRGVPMLNGVPRVGWRDEAEDRDVQRIIDRLVLEVLLNLVHRRLASELDKNWKHKRNRNEVCFITWVPDAWTLSALRQGLKAVRRSPSSVRKIVYPGHGLTRAEIADLDPVLASFNDKARLVSFDEAWV